MQRMWNRI